MKEKIVNEMMMNKMMNKMKEKIMNKMKEKIMMNK